MLQTMKDRDTQFASITSIKLNEKVTNNLIKKNKWFLKKNSLKKLWKNLDR